MISLAHAFALAWQWRSNCLRNEQDTSLADARLDRLSQELPSGSGIYDGVQFLVDESTYSKLVFATSFHHMNEVGMYTGWTEHRVVVRPLFGKDALDIRVTGLDKNDIKSYLTDVFFEVLSRQVPRS